MLKLQLKKLSPTLRGIYPLLDGKAQANGRLGDHQLFAHPDLHAAIMKLEGAGIRLIFSDIFRSAKASLEAKRAKPSLVMPAGFSAHNFGLAVDLHVDALLKEFKITKTKLDDMLLSYGLCCHRRDHKMLAESWHYNLLQGDPKRWLASGASSAATVENLIWELYGQSLKLTQDEVIAALKSLRYFDTQTTVRAAIQRFQLHWDLVADGIAGPKTQRLLAYLTSTTEIL